MIFSPQTLLGLLLGTTLLCSQAEDTCPDVNLTGVGRSDKVVVLEGWPGIPGHPGPQGPPGPQGRKGYPGVPGIAGDRGIIGEKGDRGAPGKTGKQGPYGEKGQGLPGGTGDIGLTGQKGNQGAQGITGDKGAPGEKGDLGAPGRTGDRGNTEKGNQGAPGLPGERGQTGEKGSKGEKAAEYRGAKDCKELRDQGMVLDGWYAIYPDGMQPLMVLCDMTTDGGGWIFLKEDRACVPGQGATVYVEHNMKTAVFQRRVDGSVDFYQDWETYKRGFGNQLSEFWLGNENIHRLTSGGNFQLRVDLEDFENNRTYVTYKDFSIKGEEDFYRLKLGSFIEGAAGDSLGRHRDEAFSTKDKRNDKADTIPCAKYFKGAWWFYNCFHCHLNGRYLKGKNLNPDRGVVWNDFRGTEYSLRFSEMKFRPVKK